MEDKQISELISAPKKIIKNPKKETKLIQGSYRNDFELALIDNTKVTFKVHLRKNKKFSENFSVILSYFAPELNKDIFLVRYNGSHGIHKNKIIDDEVLGSFHIHKATSEALREGYNAECWAFESNDYKTFEEAVTRFWQDMNIQDDINKFFGDYKVVQLFLFEEQESR
ncbi:MAG: hypothetical protein PHX18_04895 [Candidatus Gastranaerophilales bacterium]|nr:hypothetical protein [Candidatus Gastranaerophilales bacterium]